eukprot:gnl/MRDRNA2_/MRDRNA2_438073_c0_seq1.p1 gnl/MRDRNA2_/MRDRNA2_438073_c0~~gnl/MRDRNA2_/MRDRNA2_438073_c0_seq1.p1  ORF type:complete len:156 (+),score=33.32 gnl/MRDRNA2_/MRDRNA2_438073_c0_seq1:69-536(+)
MPSLCGSALQNKGKVQAAHNAHKRGSLTRSATRAIHGNIEDDHADDVAEQALIESSEQHQAEDGEAMPNSDEPTGIHLSCSSAPCVEAQGCSEVTIERQASQAYVKPLHGVDTAPRDNSKDTDGNCIFGKRVCTMRAFDDCLEPPQRRNGSSPAK